MKKVDVTRICSNYEFLKNFNEDENRIFEIMELELTRGMVASGVVEKKTELIESGNTRFSLAVYALPETEAEALIEAFKELKGQHPESYVHCKKIIEILKKP